MTISSVVVDPFVDTPGTTGIPGTPISISVGNGVSVGVEFVGVESVGVGSVDGESVGADAVDAESVGVGESLDVESSGIESADTEFESVGSGVADEFGVFVGVGVDVFADFEVSDEVSDVSSDDDLSVVASDSSVDVDLFVASGVSVAFELEPVELVVLSVSFDVGVGDSSLELVVAGSL